jgi:prepilin-type N-terminal cleavage/methylation domain-containing protein
MFKKLTKKLLKEETGFTLIELLVTIAILGVLFGIVTLTLSGLGSDAQSTACTAELGVVQSAVDIYMADNNYADLSADPPSDQTVSGAVIDTNDTAWGDSYLRSMPTTGTYTVNAAGDVSQDSCP